MDDEDVEIFRKALDDTEDLERLVPPLKRREPNTNGRRSARALRSRDTAEKLDNPVVLLDKRRLRDPEGVSRLASKGNEVVLRAAKKRHVLCSG